MPIRACRTRIAVYMLADMTSWVLYQTSHRINIGLPGGSGRMGGMLIGEIMQADDLHLVVATDRSDNPYRTRSGDVAGLASNGVLLGVDPASLFLEADVVIDFSAPDASMHHAAMAAETGKAMVIGITGLTPDQKTHCVKLPKRRLLHIVPTHQSV